MVRLKECSLITILAFICIKELVLTILLLAKMMRCKTGIVFLQSLQFEAKQWSLT
jgi:hypothetical protein